MAQQLTVIIPCKNERDNIQACIESVLPLADEIIVADSGSTDDTCRLACETAPCRIIQREFVNSGDFKNWAIPQAHHEWILIVDADERMTPKLAASIRQHLAVEPRYDGFWIYRRNHFMGHRVRFTSWGRDKVIRLFHRDRGRYGIHTDHAEIELPAKRCGVLKGRLVHYTCWDYEAYLQKMLRYTDQQADLWYRQGKPASLFKLIANGPLRFFRSYIMELGFLDGRVGFQISALTGFYSFLKQAKLWQRYYGLKPTQVDELARAVDHGTTNDRNQPSGGPHFSELPNPTERLREQRSAKLAIRAAE